LGRIPDPIPIRLVKLLPNKVRKLNTSMLRLMLRR
jgi:hypothetical protein